MMSWTVPEGDSVWSEAVVKWREAVVKWREVVEDNESPSFCVIEGFKIFITNPQ